jgi:hypothetical protein
MHLLQRILYYRGLFKGAHRHEQAQRMPCHLSIQSVKDRILPLPSTGCDASDLCERALFKQLLARLNIMFFDHRNNFRNLGDTLKGLQRPKEQRLIAETHKGLFVPSPNLS